MKPLAACQREFAWFCRIDSTQISLEWWKHSLRSAIRLYFPIIPIFSLVFLLISFLKTVSIDVGESLYALFQLGACLISLNASMVIYYSGYKIAKVFTRLTEIHDICKFPFKFSIVNLKCEGLICYLSDSNRTRFKNQKLKRFTNSAIYERFEHRCGRFCLCQGNIGNFNKFQSSKEIISKLKFEKVPYNLVFSGVGDPPASTSLYSNHSTVCTNESPID